MKVGEDRIAQDCKFCAAEEKEKKLTKWVQEESTAIRRFLIDLSHAGSLKKLKAKTSKATYYRNLKLCREKGYIVGDKLVRKVYTKK